MSSRWFKGRRIANAASARRPHRCVPRLESLEKREVPTTFPAGFSESNFATGISNPTAMDFAPSVWKSRIH